MGSPVGTARSGTRGDRSLWTTEIIDLDKILVRTGPGIRPTCVLVAAVFAQVVAVVAVVLAVVAVAAAVPCGQWRPR